MRHSMHERLKLGFVRSAMRMPRSKSSSTAWCAPARGLAPMTGSLQCGSTSRSKNLKASAMTGSASGIPMRRSISSSKNARFVRALVCIANVRVEVAQHADEAREGGKGVLAGDVC